MVFPHNTEPTNEQKILLANERILKKIYKRRRTQKSVFTVELEVGNLVLLRVPYPSSAIDRQTAKFFTCITGYTVWLSRSVKTLIDALFRMIRELPRAYIIGIAVENVIRPFRPHAPLSVPLTVEIEVPPSEFM